MKKRLRQARNFLTPAATRARHNHTVTDCASLSPSFHTRQLARRMSWNIMSAGSTLMADVFEETLGVKFVPAENNHHVCRQEQEVHC